MVPSADEATHAKVTGKLCGTSVATNGTFVPINFSPAMLRDAEAWQKHDEEIRRLKSEFLARGVELEVKAHEEKTNDRTITDDQRELFIKLLSEYPKTPIRVFVWGGDGETEKYARKISQLLEAAKYGNGGEIITMRNTNSDFGNPFPPNAIIFLAYGNATNYEDSFTPVGVPFNDIRPVISSGFTNDANMFHKGILKCVEWGFSGIGLKGTNFIDNTLLKPSEVGIVILPKNR